MDFSKISVQLETDEVEKFLKYFYKSEKGIDIIKLSQEIANANFYFTKTLQNLLLDIIKENKSNEKIELNFEDIKNKSKDNFYIIDSELKIFLGYKIFLQKNENVTQEKEELIQMLYETLNIDLKEILLKIQI